MDLIQQLEAEEIKRLAKVIPDFSSGDTVVVNVNVVEADRKRGQAYEGGVIATPDPAGGRGLRLYRVGDREGAGAADRAGAHAAARQRPRRRARGGGVRAGRRSPPACGAPAVAARAAGR